MGRVPMPRGLQHYLLFKNIGHTLIKPLNKLMASAEPFTFVQFEGAVAS